MDDLLLVPDDYICLTCPTKLLQKISGTSYKESRGKQCQIGSISKGSYNLKMKENISFTRASK